MNDAIRPRANSRFDVLPDLLPETDATPLGSRTWSDLFAAPQIGETDEVALAARLVQHLDGALTHPVGEDEPRSEGIPNDGIVPAGFASALGDAANVTAARGTIAAANAARPEAEQRRSGDVPVRGAAAMELHASAIASADAIDGARADSPSPSVPSVEEPTPYVSAHADVRRDHDTGTLQAQPPALERAIPAQATMTSATDTGGAAEPGGVESSPIPPPENSPRAGDAERGEADAFAAVPAGAPKVPGGEADNGAAIQRAVAPAELSREASAASSSRIPLSNASKNTVAADDAATPPILTSAGAKPSHEPSAMLPSRGVTPSPTLTGEPVMQRFSAEAAARPAAGVDALIAGRAVESETQIIYAPVMPHPTGVANGGESAVTAVRSLSSSAQATPAEATTASTATDDQLPIQRFSVPALTMPGADAMIAGDRIGGEMSVVDAAAVHGRGNAASLPVSSTNAERAASAHQADSGEARASSAVPVIVAPTKLVQHLDGALTHPVGEDEPRSESIPNDGIVPAGFANALGDAANVTAASGTIAAANGARPEVEQRRNGDTPVRGAAPMELRASAIASAEAIAPAELSREASATSSSRIPLSNASKNTVAADDTAMPLILTSAGAKPSHAPSAMSPSRGVQIIYAPVMPHPTGVANGGESAVTAVRSLSSSAQATPAEATTATDDQPPIQRFSVPALTTPGADAMIAGVGTGGEMSVVDATTVHRRGNAASLTVSSTHAERAASAHRADTAEARASSAVPVIVAPPKLVQHLDGALTQPVGEDEPRSEGIPNDGIVPVGSATALDDAANVTAARGTIAAANAARPEAEQRRTGDAPVRGPGSADWSLVPSAESAPAKHPLQRVVGAAPMELHASAIASAEAIAPAELSREASAASSSRIPPSNASKNTVAADDAATPPILTSAGAKPSHLPVSSTHGERAASAHQADSTEARASSAVPVIVAPIKAEPVFADGSAKQRAAASAESMHAAPEALARLVRSSGSPPRERNTTARLHGVAADVATADEPPVRRFPASASASASALASAPAAGPYAMIAAHQTGAESRIARDATTQRRRDVAGFTKSSPTAGREISAETLVQASGPNEPPKAASTPPSDAVHDTRPPLTLAERAFLRDARANTELAIAPQRTVPGPDRARFDAREAEQTLRINIGRIRVEAPASPSAPSRTPPARPKPHISLAEYSRQRGSEP